MIVYRKSKITRLFIAIVTSLYLLSCAPTKIIENLKSEGELERGLPSEHGLQGSVLARVDSLVKNQVYPNIHSILISKDNRLVFENYYPGKDEFWGRDLGVVAFNEDSLHDIRSVSKSIVSACIGIAIAQRKIRSVDQRVFDFFPSYKHLDTGLNKTLTVKHLLTMTTGQKWNENISYADTTNSERRMTSSKDPVEYALSQPIEKMPGTEWNYNGGSTQLLAAIIEKSTGMQVNDFANAFLFLPLGITRFYWSTFPNTNMPAAASGLRLRPRDLLKFGMLYINNGKHNGKQVLSTNWVNETAYSYVPIGNWDGNEISYGYHFYINSTKLSVGDTRFQVAIGNGNQRIFIDRKNNMVVVITAGNYNAWNIENNSHKLVYKEIYAALIKN